MDNRPPDDFHVVNTQTIPGLEDLEIVRNLQMFTQISRAKIPMGQFASMPSKYFARLLQVFLSRKCLSKMFRRNRFHFGTRLFAYIVIENMLRGKEVFLL